MSGRGLNLDTLNAAAKAVRHAQVSASYAGALAHNKPDLARDKALVAKASCGAALDVLVSLGADMPGIETDTPMPNNVPLHLLDTLASRAFLAALEAAAEAGAVLDRERGWVDGDGDPCGYGETLGGLALRLRTEIYGPAGRE